MKRLTVIKTVASGDPKGAVEFLAEASGLSRMRIKDAMEKGALRRTRKGGKATRLRKATASLHPGDRIEFYYDEALLAAIPPQAALVHDEGHYSVWNKPAGLLTQGTRYGDHCTLLRQAEQYFVPRREVYPVHRLDREASGLVLITHSSRAAATFSELFRLGKVDKTYRAEVRGDLAEHAPQGVIDRPLEGKEARTEYRVIRYREDTDTTIVEVRIGTGRLHQIRRHLDGIGFPVMGDPRYGRGNKNREGLKLSAAALSFTCPFSGRAMVFSSEVINRPTSATRGWRAHLPCGWDGSFAKKDL